MNNNLESEQPMLGKSCLFYDIYYIVHLKCINYPRADILNKKNEYPSVGSKLAKQKTWI